MLPVFPLGTVLFPDAMMPLHIFEERYRRMLHDSQNNDPAFVIALAKTGSEDAAEGRPESVGTACRVSGVNARPDGRSDIVVSGTARVRISDIDWSNGYAVGGIETLDDVVENPDRVAERYTLAKARFARYLHGLSRLIGEDLPQLDPSDDPGQGSWLIGQTLTLHTAERQRLLQEPTVDSRIALVDAYLRREYALLTHTGVIGSTIDYPGRNLMLN
jgi:Lon protease-like protein